MTLCATTQGKYDDAERLYERCQTIQEKVLGREHPSLAETLGDRASLYVRQVRGDRAMLVVVCLRVHTGRVVLDVVRRCYGPIFREAMGGEHGALAVVRECRREIRRSRVWREPGALAG